MNSSPYSPPNQASEATNSRRAFLKRAFTLLLGGIATLFPVGAGFTLLLDPLRRAKTRATNGPGRWVRVTQLEAVPPNGIPQRFPVIAQRTDVWNKYKNMPIGAVYLRRTGPNHVHVSALNVICPHAGCFVDFHKDKKLFICPCHDSSFALDGEINDPNSPSPRPMDGLEVEVRGKGEVWVNFKNFQSGIPKKVATA